MEHKVHILQQRRQLGHVIVTGKAHHLHVLALGQVQLQVFANETNGTGDQNFLGVTAGLRGTAHNRLQTQIHSQQIQAIAQGCSCNQRIWQLDLA